MAHRGASDRLPEHTLAAYLSAIEAGADALECDVRLTADGHLVCVHDRTVARTSNGSGRVSTLELAQLEGLDWGAWRRLDAAGQNGAQRGRSDVQPDLVAVEDRSQLLTLRRLLGVVADTGGRVQLAVETKHPNRYGGEVERALVEQLRRHGWLTPSDRRCAPVRMMSFSQLAVRRMRELAPGVPLVLLTERLPAGRRDGRLPRGVDISGIGLGVLRRHPDYVRRVQERGGRVHVWTVDEPQDVAACLQAGVDGLITNRPAEVLAQFNDAECANDGSRSRFTDGTQG